MQQTTSARIVLNNQSDVITVMSSDIGTQHPGGWSTIFFSQSIKRDRTPRVAKHKEALNAELKDRTSCGETDITIKALKFKHLK